MVGDPRPFYRFEFRGGLSLRGDVERCSAAIGGGQSDRIRYGLNDLPLVASLGRPMPADVADLIDVSAAVYIADRLAPRRVPEDSRASGNRWHRRIHVIIPMRCPELWRRCEVLASLQNLLAILTDDIWTFEFTDRTCALRPAEAQGPLFTRGARRTEVILFSGGLDSLFGLASLLTDGLADCIVPVTVVTNGRIRRAVDSAIHEIRGTRAVSGPQLVPARLRVEISGEGRPRDDRESTQRARAMLFLASGIGAAVMAGSDRLWVCENGVGAIALPMSSDHWGAHSTRAMHPKTLKLMSGLARMALGRPFSIENIGVFATKGTLGQNFALSPFAAAARHTNSCDRATYLAHGEACGKCTSCLLRRIALVAADMDDFTGGKKAKYSTDWFDPGAVWSRENVIPLLAMRDQVERLRTAIGDGNGFGALDRAFPDIFDVVTLAPTIGMTEGEITERLIRLYTTYVSEFDAFVARIDRPGWGRRTILSELVRTPVIAATG